MARGRSEVGAEKDESPANKQDWHDRSGHMRGLRETLAAVYPTASLRRLADAATAGQAEQWWAGSGCIAAHP